MRTRTNTPLASRVEGVARFAVAAGRWLRRPAATAKPDLARKTAGTGSANGRGQSSFGPCLLRGGRHGLVAFATLVLCVLVAIVAAQPATTSQAAPRFAYVDVLVDPHGRPLAAYQFEFAGGANCQIVGIEGGEHPAFAQPPYYDLAAMQADRVIAAAYSTAEQLPAARTRVSRLHLRLTGPPAYQIRLVTAGSTDGKPMDAGISIREGDAK